MIYLDNGATSYPKPSSVRTAMQWAMKNCTNPGRGGYGSAMAAAELVYQCRETAAAMFSCRPEQIAFTSNCTHGLNIAISTLVQPGDPVLISGFEHNAVTRPLHALQARLTVAGRRLFDWENILSQWEDGLKSGVRAAIFTHVSNVFGYILPIVQMAALCRQYGVPFIVDAAQSAGMIDVNFEELGADFLAMPGHKGLLGPQGTGMLLCGSFPKPLICGGTGSLSLEQSMPDFLPDRLEAGTVNVPGIAGMLAGMRYVNRTGMRNIFSRQVYQAGLCIRDLRKLGMQVFSGAHQSGTVSFLPGMDCQEVAERLASQGIAVRAGLHCAPLAHEQAGTLQTGTLRVSFGHDACDRQRIALLRALGKIMVN